MLKQFRTRSFCLFCILILAWILAPLTLAKNSPSLSLQPDHYDFGEVDEGVEIEHTFQVKNVGTKALIIRSVDSTCGCTVPKISKKSLQPGESTSLRVIVDTAMKQNKITKTVTISSNDRQHPVTELQLAMNVRDPHKGLTKETAAKIFTNARCAACHVAQGVGLYGEELYEADCAMCHGFRGGGAVGPRLLGAYEEQAFSDHMKKVISLGSPTSRSMPGFLADAGGPLDQKQIDSIVEYLAKLSKPGKRSQAGAVTGKATP
jgi:mono/diheme cytochrome c family protein